jgi:hypothetical protein
MAVDDIRVHVTAINCSTFPLQPSGQQNRESTYGAATLFTGAVLWETAVPKNRMSLGQPTVVGDLAWVATTGQDPNGMASYDTT